MAILTLEPLDKRIPDWDHDHLTSRCCPFCGQTSEAQLIRPDRLPVAFCNTCGCWYVQKLPSQSDIRKLYSGYFYVHRPSNLSSRNISELVASSLVASQTNWMLQAALRLYTGDGPARLLDVGCGVGRFLLEAKSVGMAVVGCDLSPEACKFINDQLQISAHHAELHECSSAIGMVDVVVMNDFIEHPTHPLSAIEAAVSILRPGGLLLVHTPNGGEAGKNPEIAKNWVGFRVDLEHLQYLSPHTVNWLAKKYGLMVERLETSGFPNLNALGGSPIQSSRVTSWIKQVVKKIPGSTPTVRLAQSLRTGMTGSNNDPRLGSYHLYAILRKL